MVTLILSMLWTWISIRLFVVTSIKPEQVGDPSAAFSLSSFFPDQYSVGLNKISEIVWSITNACGVLTRLQGLIGPKAAVKAAPVKKEQESELSADTEAAVPLT